LIYLCWKGIKGNCHRSALVFSRRFSLDRTTHVAPAISVIAGGRYPYLRFLLYNLSGKFIQVPLFGSLDDLFASQWERVSQAINTFSGLSFGLFFLALGPYYR